MRTVLSVALLLLAGPAFAADATDAKLVSFDDLSRLVNDNRGKVVLVDLWTTSCIPCIKKFPELVAMQEKLGPDGFTILSVNVDPGVADAAEHAAIVKAIQARLAASKLTLTNLILNEKPEVVQHKLHFGQDGTVPMMFVFTRAGKWWQFRDPVNDWEKLQQLVQDELKKK